MAQVTDKTCRLDINKRTMVDAMRGIIPKCAPGCVHTMYKTFQFDLTPEEIKYFTSVEPIPYQDCLQYKNCQPSCIDAYRNSGSTMEVVDQAKQLDTQSIQSSVDQARTKTYLIIGGSVLAAGIVYLLGNQKKKPN